MAALEELKDYYRKSLASRIAALEAARAGVAQQDRKALGEVREIAHTLRGSGASYGFPEVTEAAGALEDAPEADAAARVDALLEVLADVAGGRSAMKILLVDDDADMLLLASTALGKTGGHEVLQESNAERALERARDERPDAILTDCVMPGLDGPAFVARLRADPATRAIPVIFLTGKVGDADRERLLGSGAVGVIHKPFDPLELSSLMQRLLRQPPG